MPKTEPSPKYNIACLARDTKLNLSPSRWLSVVEKASEASLRTIKGDSSKRTVMTALAPWGQVCLHDFEWDLKKSLLSPLRPFRGKQVWKHCLALLKLEIPITEPLLYIEIKEGPFVVRTYFVTRWIDGENLGCAARTKEALPEKRFRALLKKAAELAAEFHGAGFVHGDMKWSNFLWTEGPPYKVYLSDLDHVEKTGAAERQAKDLARFVLSALEYRLGWDAANDLKSWYFDSRSVRPVGFEKFLNKHIERKKGKYESRNANLFSGRTANDS
jgi:hypothetical protein